MSKKSAEKLKKRNWKSPTLQEARKLLSKIDIDDVIVLLNIERSSFYNWQTDNTKKFRKISYANSKLIELYLDGKINLDGEAV